MDSAVTPSPSASKLASLQALFYAVAATAGMPGAAVAFNAPPPIAPPCAAGYWSSTGRTPCNLADLGRYVSSEGATSQTPAPIGSYVDTVGASAAKPAPLGSYVDTVGASAAKLAPVGSYVNTPGASAPTLAPIGSYVDTTGAVSAKLAPLGRYVDTVGASAAKPAPLGSYVDTVGAASAKLAPLGRYVDTVGASAAKLAPAGSFVDTVGASSVKLAPVGFYVDTPGQSAALAAPPGRFAATAGSVAAAACPGGTNSYGAASACRITVQGHAGPGVTPVFDSTFGTGGSHVLGAVNPGDSFAFRVSNTSTDLANDRRLTGLTLWAYIFSDPDLFDLVGFTPGMELAAGGGEAALSLQAKGGLPVGPFSFMLTIKTDQFADYQGAGQSFVYNFSGFHVTAVPEPGAAALLLAGLSGLAMLSRRRRSAERAATRDAPTAQPH